MSKEVAEVPTKATVEESPMYSFHNQKKKTLRNCMELKL